MDSNGQPNSNNFRAIAPFVKNPLTRKDYLERKFQIDEAREKLAQMEREMELQELMRQGREAEQKLARMKAAHATLPAGPSTASDSNHYPNAHYRSVVHEVPLTARIEGEVQDMSSNSSRPPEQVQSTQFQHRYNYPTATQPQQASFQAHTPQFPPQHLPQRSFSSQTQAQGTTRSHSPHAQPYNRAPAFTVRGYQHSFPPSIPSSSGQQMQTSQSYQQQRLSEEYWAQQSQRYAAELAAAKSHPRRAPSSGVNPQVPGKVMPHYAPVQHQTPLPATTSDAISSRQHLTISAETQPSFNHRSSGGDPALSGITKQDFIHQFQIACEHDATYIRSFLSTRPVAVEWMIEAVSSVDPANLKDAGAITLLIDMRKRLQVSSQSTSTSASTDVHVPKVVDAPATTDGMTVQSSPPPTDPSSTQRKSTSFDTKENYMASFNEICRRGDVDKATNFLIQHESEVPLEWQQALISSLNPELVARMRPVYDRAKRRAQEAAKPQLASNGAAKLDGSSNNNVAQQNRSLQTIIPNEVLTQSAPTLPKPVPAPPRPSVSRTQAQSSSAQPLSTSNYTTANTLVASATQATSARAAQVSAPAKQTAPAHLTQPTTFNTSQQQPLTGTVAYGRHYSPYAPPPLRVPIADGKYVEYIFDPYLNQYVRSDIIMNRQAVPQGISGSTHIISIPPATPLSKPSGTTTQTRTPQQADKSHLARDILRSLGASVTVEEEEREEEESDEEASSSENLHVTITTERQQTRDSSPELSHETPQDALPPTVSMEHDQEPPAEPAAIAIHSMIDNEANTIAPDNGASSLIPPSDTAPIQASTTTNPDDLTRRADEMSLPKSPSPKAISGAVSILTSQDELARGVDGMSITTDMCHPGPSREDRQIDTISFPDPDEHLPPLPEPVGSSSPTPSLRAQSRMQIEDVGNGVLPLFLPSPSVSPAPSDDSLAPLPPETDDEVIMVESMLRGVSSSKRGGDSDILSLDDERSLTPPRHVRRKKGQRVYVLVPPPPIDLRRAIKKRKLEESGIVSGSEEEESKYNDFERAFMADCKFRMVERPCQWGVCDALLNCGQNLYLHLKLHMQETSSKGLYICRWQSCPRRFKSEAAMEEHLQMHSYFPFPCPIANCPDVFDEPSKAIQHEVRQRHESITNLPMKQRSNLHVPEIPPKLDPPPHVLPSYRVEPRYVRQAHIPPQRHSVIGPWVLQHIHSPVEQNLRKQNAPMRLRYPRQDARPENLDSLRARPDEYDFLAPLSTLPTRSIRFDDLDSAGVSVGLHGGLTLWDIEPDSDSREATRISRDGDRDVVMKTTDTVASRSIPTMMTDTATATVDGMYGSQWATGL